MHVDDILVAIRRSRLQLKERISVFGAAEISLIEIMVNLSGINTVDGKLQAINDWPEPSSTAELLLFLGLAGYYRKCVHMFAHRTTPL